MTIHQVMNRQIGKQNKKCITFCIALVQLLDTKNIEDAMLEILLHNFTAWDKKRYKCMLAAKSQIYCKRKSREHLEFSLTETQSQRYFWMSQDYFADLCHQIKDIIGHKEFKRETFTHKLEQTVRKKSNTMVHLHWVSTGLFVSSEIKIAICWGFWLVGRIWILLCCLEFQPDTFTNFFIGWWINSFLMRVL